MSAEVGTDHAQAVPDGIAETSLGDRLRAALAARSPEAGPVLGSPGRHLDGPEFAALVDSWARTVRRAVADAGPWEPTADLPRRPVAVLVDADLDTIVAIAAVVSSGHPLVVLDPMVPDARRELIVETATAVALSPSRLRSLAAESGDEGASDEVSATVDVAPGDPAVVVFTSGSTGRPKAVVHSHAFWLNQILEARLAFGLTGEDRVAQVLPVSYGAGLDVLFMALLNGSALAYYDPRQLGLRGLIEWLTVERATTLHCTPALLRSILADLPPAASVPGSARRDAPLAQFRLVTTCGEQSFGSDVALMRLFAGDDTVFVNWSGSSETGHLAFFPIPPDDVVPEGPLPAGTPAANKTVRIRDAAGVLATTGEPGALEVVSPFLFSGYLGDPELTATKRTALPDGTAVFRMGDRARLDDAGTLQLLGRGDSAVKIRGYLVEPSEVEAALRSVDAVGDAAVVTVPVPGTGRDGEDYTPPQIQLAAYVSLDPARPAVPTAALRAALRERLPSWMQPHSITLVATVPRTERGKIDLAALPEPVAARSVIDSPRGTTEQQLAALWARLAEVEEVGRDQTLAELGADSLVVEAMLAAACDGFGVDLVTSDVTQHPTLAEFATLVEERAAGRAPVSTSGLSVLTSRPIGAGGGAPTVFCLAGAGGHGSGFAALAALLENVGSVYAIQMRGLEGGRPDLTMRLMTRRVRTLIEETAPGGPLVLIGHSLGGLLATAVGSQLTAAGRDVRLVAALDTLLPHKAVPGSPPAGVTALPRTLAGALTRRGGRRPEAALVPSQRYAEDLRSGTGRTLWESRTLVAGAVLGRQYPIGVHKQVYYELGARIVRNYTPVPYRGRSVLVVSHENEDEPHWWDPILPGLRERLSLPCDHIGVLKPPYVQQTAEAVNTALRG